MNNINLIGRFTNETALEVTTENLKCFNNVLAVTYRKGRNGKADITDFIPVVAYDKVAENLANYTEKGDRIAVTGALRTSTYKNKEGVNIKTFYVIINAIEFLESKKRKNSDTPDNLPFK